MKEFELEYNVDPLEVLLNSYAQKTERDKLEVYSAVLAIAVYAYVAAIHTVAVAVLVAVVLGIYIKIGAGVS